jgi:serine/threonine protein kinase
MVLEFFSNLKNKQSDFDELDFIKFLKLNKNKTSNISIYPIDDNINTNQKTLKMIKLQKSFNHENISKIKDSLATKNFIFIESESMECSLKEILSSTKKCLSEDHIKYILYQMVVSIANLHDKGVEHLDVHPLSFMIAKNCHTKLTNFINANPVFLPQREELKSTYQNYYVAPEIILNNGKNGHCSFKADIWALGCVFFEMLEEKNVFYHQRFYLDQIKWIFRLLGTPSRTSIGWIQNLEAKQWVLKLKKEAVRKPSSYLGRKDLSSNARDLLDQMLVVNPYHRLSALQILKHPFFEDIYDHNDLRFSESCVNSKRLLICHPRNEDLAHIKKTLIKETLI